MTKTPDIIFRWFFNGALLTPHDEGKGNGIKTLYLQPTGEIAQSDVERRTRKNKNLTEKVKIYVFSAWLKCC